MNRDGNILEHIIQYCDDIANSLERFGNDYEVFQNDRDFKNSVSMSIMQIGELTTHLSDEFKKNTSKEIPWGLIKGMRNHYAHGYSFMDSKEIFETAINDIPFLKEKCQFLISQHTKKEEDV